MSVVLSLALLSTRGLWTVHERCLEVAAEMAKDQAEVDFITAYEARFDHIRAQLPLNGVVGYHQRYRGKSADELGYLHLIAQYTLAPLRVLRNAHCDIDIIEGDDGVQVIRN